MPCSPGVEMGRRIEERMWPDMGGGEGGMGLCTREGTSGGAWGGAMGRRRMWGCMHESGAWSRAWGGEWSGSAWEGAWICSWDGTWSGKRMEGCTDFCMGRRMDQRMGVHVDRARAVCDARKWCGVVQERMVCGGAWWWCGVGPQRGSAVCGAGVKQQHRL
eukprot:363433-Chlamydomonas_euryale.AAC.17